MTVKVSTRSAVPPFLVMEILAQATARARAGADVIHLEVGQPADPAPEAVREAAIRALRDHPLGYTEATGLPALRARIARHYGERHGLDVDPARVVVTTGSSAAFLLTTLACFDVGDRVLVPSPGYPAYRHTLAALGVRPEPMRVDATTRWLPTPGHVGPAAGLVVASPSNPTGTSLDRPALAALAAACREHGVVLVSDELYQGLSFGMPPPTALAVDDDAVVLSGFSKTWAMTGWRLGWMVVPPALVGPVDRLAQSLFLAPPTLPQLVAAEAFDAHLDDAAARYAASRRLLVDGLPALGLDRFVPPDGAFYLWVDVSALTDDSVAWCRRLLDDTGVALTPGVDFDPERGHRFVRISFAGAPDDVAEALRRLGAWIRSGRA